MGFPFRTSNALIATKLGLVFVDLSNDDRPKLEHFDVSRSILKSLISMKLGLGLMLESDAGVRIPSVVFEELRDGTGSTRVDFSAFWQASNQNSALLKFFELLQERYLVLP